MSYTAASKYVFDVVATSVKLNENEFNELIIDYRNGNQEALETIFKGLYKMIFNIIFKNYRQLEIWETPFDDVFNQFILITKEKIIDVYDVNRGVKLSTVVNNWLNLAMIQLPRFIGSDSLSMKRVKNGYEKDDIMSIESFSPNGDNEDELNFDITHLIENNESLIKCNTHELIDAIETLDKEGQDYIKQVFGVTVDGSHVKRRVKEETYLNKKKMSIEKRNDILNKVREYLVEIY